jgi:hypothetical protein
MDRRMGSSRPGQLYNEILFKTDKGWECSSVLENMFRSVKPSIRSPAPGKKRKKERKKKNTFLLDLPFLQKPASLAPISFLEILERNDAKSFLLVHLKCQVTQDSLR